MGIKKGVVAFFVDRTNIWWINYITISFSLLLIRGKMTPTPGLHFLTNWALVRALVCCVGLFYHTSVLVDILKRTTAALPNVDMLFAVFQILFMIFWFSFGFGCVFFMKGIGRKLVVSDDQDTSCENRKPKDSSSAPHFLDVWILRLINILFWLKAAKIYNEIFRRWLR